MSKQDLFVRWLTARGGVTHTSEARVAGFDSRVIAAIEAKGRIRRIRRSWIVLPNTDAATCAALAVAGRLTCVTAAADLGWWVPPNMSDATHVAVAPTASRIERDGVHLHWSRGPAPTARYAVREHSVNVLAHVAGCLDRMDALAVWNSAARSAQTSPRVLKSVAWSTPRARELAHAVSVLSDSGLETHAVERFRALGLAVQQQVWIADQPVDLLIGELLVVQVDGAHHLEQRQRRRDIRHDARLRLMGYTVLRFDYQQVLFDWAYVESVVTTAVAQGLHLAASATRRAARSG